MLFEKLTLVSALVALATAQSNTDINISDIPSLCQPVCTDVYSLQQNCQRLTPSKHITVVLFEVHDI
jgi:hypothetical protein